MDAIRDTNGDSRIFTFYEDFFCEPRREIERLVDFCGLSLPPHPDAIVESVSNLLRHHVARSMDLLTEEKMLLENKFSYLSLRALTLVGFRDGEGTEMTSAACGKLAALIDDLHSQNKMTQLQSALAERDLVLRRLVEENRSLKVSLDSFARSLTWQLYKKLEKIKDRFLPSNTGRRKIYDQFLMRIKKSNLSYPSA